MRFYVDEVLKVSSWEEVLSRPMFVHEIDPSKTKPVEVIAAYSIPDKEIRCGLKDCHQPHIHGFLVRTTDGTEANIGRICGQNIFGDEFKKLANEYIQWRRDQERKVNLNLVLDSKDLLRRRVKNIINKPFGANWLYRSISEFRKKYPEEIVSEIQNRARRNDTIVKRVREWETDELQHAHGSDYRYEANVIGEFKGLEVFRLNIRDLIVDGISKQLDELDTLNPSKVSTRKLRELDLWASSIEETFEQIERLIDEGKLFFYSDNLCLLPNLNLSNKARAKLEVLRWDYKNGCANKKRIPNVNFSLANYYRKKVKD